MYALRETREGPSAGIFRARIAITGADLSNARTGGMPRPRDFPVECVRALTEQEWRRRLGRTHERGSRTRDLIVSLIAHALVPESTARRESAERRLEDTRRAFRAEGRTGDEIDRLLCELSSAFWHALLAAGIQVERAFALRDAIDGLLLEGVDRDADAALRRAFAPEKGFRHAEPLLE